LKRLSRYGHVGRARSMTPEEHRVLSFRVQALESRELINEPRH
jgi:hypothetical protein